MRPKILLICVALLAAVALSAQTVPRTISRSLSLADDACSGLCITSTSGTLANGNTITITGTELHNQDTTNWKTHFKTTNPNAWNMSGANFAADGYTEAGGTTAGSSVAYAAEQAIFGSNTLKMHIVSLGTNCPTDNASASVYHTNDAVDQNDDWYWRVYARWDVTAGSWPSSHVKMVGSQGGGEQIWYTQPHNDGTQFTTVYDGANHFYTPHDGAVTQRRWYAIEGHYATGTNPHVVQIWIDGELEHDASPVADGAAQFFLTGVINACGGTFTFDHWMDGIVTSTSRIYPASLVELGDTATYATATKVTQEVTSITDTSVDFTVDLTGLGAGPTYYLYVTNNTQTVSAAKAIS